MESNGRATETARARPLWSIFTPPCGNGPEAQRFTRAGRARARARAKYTRKSRNLNFSLGQFYFRSRQKLFSFSSLATVPNLISIRADLEKLWWKWKIKPLKIFKFLNKLDQNRLEISKTSLPERPSLCALPSVNWSQPLKVWINKPLKSFIDR